jgi:ribonucleotide reductase alpha subunit
MMEKIRQKVIVHKTIKAKYLWDLICTAAWQSAEPVCISWKGLISVRIPIILKN